MRTDLKENWDSIVFDLKRGWAAYLAVLLTLVTIVGVYVLVAQARTVAYEPVEATITGLGYSDRDQKWQPGYVQVSAVTDDGLTGMRTVPDELIRGCQVGDRVNAERKGLVLRLKLAPCDESHPFAPAK